MKKLTVGTILALLAISTARAQWLETTIPVGNYPWALVYNSTNNKIYCANNSGVTVINGATNQVIKTIAEVIGLALVYNPTNNKVYCACDPNNVTIINGATDSVITSVTVGFSPEALIWNSHNNKVYCANNGDSTVTVIDGVTDSVIMSIVVGYHNYKSLMYNPTSNKVYCTKYNFYWGFDSTVTVIDGAADTVITSVTIGYGAGVVALGCNPLNNKVYCADYLSDNVAVIDGVTDSVVATVATGNGIWIPLLHNPTDNKIYCADWGDNVIVIDGAADSVIATIALGSECLTFVHNMTNNKVYCACIPNEVVIIDGAGDSAVTAITVGDSPRAFTWNPLQNRVYVANSQSHTVSVIRDSMTGIQEDAGYTIRDSRYRLTVHPNPFTHFADIRYQITDDCNDILLEIYDVTGRRVKDFTKELSDIGHQSSVKWDGTNQANHQLGSGVYFVKFISGNYAEIKKVLRVRHQ